MSGTSPLESVKPVRLMGYAEPWSASPGDTVRFMVSCESEKFDARVVRLRRGGPRPRAESALVVEHLPTDADGTYPGLHQDLRPGSYAVVPHDDGAGEMNELSIEAWIYPTRVDSGSRQGVIGKVSAADRRGWVLQVEEDGRLSFNVYGADGERRSLKLDKPLLERHWHYVICSVAADGQVKLGQRLKRKLGIDPATDTKSISLGADLRLSSTAPWLIGAAQASPQVYRWAEGCFNGKIDSPRVGAEAFDDFETAFRNPCECARPAVGSLAAWDFSRDPGTATITDISGNRRHGKLVNAPMRAVTGHNWTGQFLDYRLAPEQYGAIHFHDDDLEDAGWEPSVELTVPDGTESGVYALEISCGEDRDLIPFFIRPPRGTKTAPVAVILPTFTYIAYANFLYDPADADWMTGGEAVYDDVDPYVWTHPELGYSMYNHHTDGSGIAYGSIRRPILDMRPEHGFWLSAGGGWGFSSDMYLIDWLEATGQPYDVLTDHDLHEEGAALLAGYRAVLTGSHPEYTSREMLDAYQHYSEHGGNIMYLGGNGFYWVTTQLPDRPHVIEIRRGHAGTRTWESEPGEVHHSSTGEPGGLWRHRGWAPQRIFGVGMDAQGGGGSAAYEATEAARDPRVEFIFEGVDLDGLIGDFGNNMGGAAGDEIDRLDYRLGTPPHALLLATSSGRHSDLYLRTVEEVPVMLPGQGGTECPEVRADMTYFETPGGGAVFTTGSINWIASLSHNDYDNNVSRITGNVLRRFAQTTQG